MFAGDLEKRIQTAHALVEQIRIAHRQHDAGGNPIDVGILNVKQIRRFLAQRRIGMRVNIKPCHDSVQKLRYLASGKASSAMRAL